MEAALEHTFKVLTLMRWVFALIHIEVYHLSLMETLFSD